MHNGYGHICPINIRFLLRSMCGETASGDADALSLRKIQLTKSNGNNKNENRTRNIPFIDTETRKNILFKEKKKNNTENHSALGATTRVFGIVSTLRTPRERIKVFHFMHSYIFVSIYFVFIPLVWLCVRFFFFFSFFSPFATATVWGK